MSNREIKIYIEDDSFLYDVSGLIGAFYHGRRIVRTDDPGEADMKISIPVGADRSSVKNELKRELYKRLSADTGMTLPWGTLTGVRPTKLTLRMLAGGMSREEMMEQMAREYYTSAGKAALASDIAITERRLVSELYSRQEDPISLYIGIPFCPSICLYCSFSSYAIGAYRDSVEDYLAALKDELRGAAEVLRDRPIASVYFGGGTPTSLSAAQLDGLLSTVEECFDLSGLSEYTVEAGRPDSITEDKLSVLSSYGVGRISINPQTLQQTTLDTIGRRHSVEDFYRAYELARRYPFIINTDLIVGLPGEGEKEVGDTLKRIGELSPDNLTVHSLAKKRASRLTDEWDEYVQDSFVYTDHTGDMVYDTAKALSMEPYYMYRQKEIAGNMENVGFAIPGRECLYNVLMMEEACDIAAFGAGAVSKRIRGSILSPVMPQKSLRQRNPKDVKNYIERTGEVIEKKRELFDCTVQNG